MSHFSLLWLSGILCAAPLVAQEAHPFQVDTATPAASARPGIQTAMQDAPPPAQRSGAMPVGTPVPLVSLEEISSNGLTVGTPVKFTVAEDIVHGSAVVIPRGSPATGTVTWKTGKAIGGKSGKFEVSFQDVQVNGNRYRLMGKHRQEGRGNTVGAVLGSIVISGRSAVMLPGQVVQALTAEPINP